MMYTIRNATNSVGKRGTEPCIQIPLSAVVESTPQKKNSLCNFIKLTSGSVTSSL